MTASNWEPVQGGFDTKLLARNKTEKSDTESAEMVQTIDAKVVRIEAASATVAAENMQSGGFEQTLGHASLDLSRGKLEPKESEWLCR